MTATARKPMAPLPLVRVWRGSVTAPVVTFIVAYLIYGCQPDIGASTDTLVPFYDGDRTRILIASALPGISVLNLLWFRRRAATTRHARARSFNPAVSGSLPDPAIEYARAAPTVMRTTMIVAIAVLDTVAAAPRWFARLPAPFPTAMLDMAGTFGLRHARMISSRSILAGVAAVVLVLLGGTTWASAEVWSPDGTYSRVIWPLIALASIAIVSGFLYAPRPSTAPAPQPTAVGVA